MTFSPFINHYESDDVTPKKVSDISKKKRNPCFDCPMLGENKANGTNLKAHCESCQARQKYVREMN